MSSGDIKNPTSALNFFRRDVEKKVRHDLEIQGNVPDIGSVMREINARWNSLPAEERLKYDEMAAEDRERYDIECIRRNEEAEREHARKRAEWSEAVTGPRSTRNQISLHNDGASLRRELSENEKEQKRLKAEKKAQEREDLKAMKKQMEGAIQNQQGVIKEAIAEQAQARLEYLLKQSDIFAHFGVGKEQADRLKAEQMDNLKKKSKKGIKEEDSEIASGDEDESVTEGAAPTFLTQQPSLIVSGEMRHYQLEGLNWMIRLNNHGINGILADEMGLGKTLQSISILAYMYEHQGIRGPHLVLVPKSTLSNWMNEFNRWCPSLRPICFHGHRDERTSMIQKVLKPGAREDSRNWDVLLTTYEVANMEKKVLQKFAFRYLIVDEAHRLKNEASLFSQTVRSLNMQHRLLLTGTPLQNNLHELWALLNFLLPDVFSSADQFDEWFNLEIDDKEAKERMIQQLHKILRPFMLRRLKADVEKNLPPKNETILFVGMSSKQKEVYRNILLRDIDSVNGNGGASGRTAILNIVMQLRKCCNHPYLFSGVEDRTLDPLGEHIVQNCGKMVLLSKLLHKLYERKNRVLIFSQMTRMLDILEDFCIMRQYEYCRIDGSTSYENREDFIDEYNRPGSTKFIFMLSTRAGGLGINLQTADTVILYDSDWNPQADLQAMDRAHRIGQKNTVNVYRFVTENTVEEKVVERAQQKLKMDAMIVQQGRLQDQSNKKFTKEELLDAIRFGADTVFRSKESSISDEDIDAILAAGLKRTKEIEARISKADKGDMLDFRLDGGLSMQKFEGIDYSKSVNRIDPSLPFYIDTGKRERKKVQSYQESDLQHTQKVQQTATKKRNMRLPKHLRLPKMDEWQFYNRKRLNELYEMEEEIYLKLKQENNLPNFSESENIQLLSPELVQEKEALVAEGFSDWTKAHYQLFVKASAKYGRNQIDKIALEVGKVEAEVSRYAAAFWTLGSTYLSPAEWDRHLRNVERGEKKIEEINRLMDATRKFVGRFKNPWEQLTFQYISISQGKVFNAPEDRYLLCLAHQYGYGAWDQVKAAIRRSGRFRFDYFLRSCSSDALGKRCEALMRAAEKENVEWEKRHLASAEKPGEREKALEEDRRRAEESERTGKIAEFELKIQEEAKKLAELRISKQKRKQAAIAESLVDNDDEASGTKGSTKGNTTRVKGSGSSGTQMKVVPENLLPRLAQIIHGSGSKSIDKLATEFVFLHPETSKRQVEKKILEMSEKQKRDGDQRDSWYLKQSFMHLLEKAANLPQVSSFGEGTTTQLLNDRSDPPTKGVKSGKKRKSDDLTNSGRNPYSWFKEGNREKAHEELRSEGFQHPTPEQVKAKLKRMWIDLEDVEKDEYVLLAVKNGFKKQK